MKEVKYDCLKKETEQAYLFVINGKDIWLPKSAVVVYKLHKKLEIEDWLYFKSIK